MKRRIAPTHSQRGVAIVTALLLTTLAITIVASLFWQQQVQVRAIENQRLQLQKQWVLRGALDWAALILREDAKYSNVDTLDEPWAVPLAETRLDQYVENGRDSEEAADATLSGGISDAQARLNLTNLCPDGTVNPSQVAAFARLLDIEKLDPALAQVTADVMAAALKKPDTNVTIPNSLPAPQPVNLTQVDDLLAVPGFTPAMLYKIKDLVIFLPRATPINVNTAPAEVLASGIDGLTLADATTLVASRVIASFRSITDFTARLPGNSLHPEADIKTNYFLVNGKVRLSRAGMNMQALVERIGTNTRLVWIREL